MSTFENDNYRWRETYFIMFSSENRPTVTQVQQELGGLCHRFELIGLQADDQGRFESVTLKAPDDFAALDICFLEGEEVLEQRLAIAKEVEHNCGPDERHQVEMLQQCDARLDVLHFQDVAAGHIPGEDDSEEMHDPGALLIVLEALVELTSGVAVDPQSGSIC